MKFQATKFLKKRLRTFASESEQSNEVEGLSDDQALTKEPV